MNVQVPFNIKNAKRFAAKYVFVVIDAKIVHVVNVVLVPLYVG